MSGKTILVTGGHGFIGSNFIHYYLNKYPDYQIVNIDYNTEAASPENISCPEQQARYSFHRIDIRNAYAINHLFERYDITDIVHFAAETRNMERVGEIRLYEQTNVLGKLNLLQAAQHAWMESNHQPKLQYVNSRFHHIALEDRAMPSLYTDSKKRADAATREFHTSTGLNIVTTVSPEIFGPMQKETGKVPMFIQRALEGEHVIEEEIHNHKHNWLFVRDLCEAIDAVFHLGEPGGRYELGSNARMSDGELASLLQDYFLGNKQWRNDRVENQQKFFRKQTKNAQLPGLIPTTSFEKGLRITLDWYITKNKSQAFLKHAEDI